MRTIIKGVEDKNEQNNETLRSKQENLEQSVQELKVSVCVMQLSPCFLIRAHFHFHREHPCRRRINSRQL
ncbi:hypothetical protein HOLleu_26704 [Holothuria leucospilota]|uniref:Uncharacterized protein n=1 Tax=Holothuria leucospilota TaxID=206669 RepID=A0A9Q1BPC0_HOLLE|nr:hypothetical protein HOLleu_26704 [Holothuria leucospilota]